MSYCGDCAERDREIARLSAENAALTERNARLIAEGDAHCCSCQSEGYCYTHPPGTGAAVAGQRETSQAQPKQGVLLAFGPLFVTAPRRSGY
jgi:hypothetical protein